MKKTDTHHYEGKSTEIKPKDAPYGSTYLEVDSGVMFFKGLNVKNNNGWQTITSGIVASEIEAATGVTSSGTTGGTLSAGAGNQYVEMKVGASVYKVLHDGTV